MVFVLLFVVGICLYQVEISKINNYQLDYMSIEKTKSIKGIFTLMVFLSHFAQYVDLNSPLDRPYLLVKDFLGQLVVTMFLFYSGYGVLESIRKKGQDYVDDLPKKRILKVLFDFDLAIILFLIVAYFLGKKYRLTTILLSFIGWTSVGNSNWYIFVILITYIFTYLAFKVSKDNYFLGVTLVLFLSGLYIYLVRDFRPSYSYNTIFCYGLGMLYSLFRDKIENFIFKNKFTYLLSFIVSLGIFILTYKMKNKLWAFQIRAIFFIGLVILISMKISFNNLILNWVGGHLFSIYILQRIPMMILGKVEFVQSRTYLYLVLTAFSTGLIAYIFTKVSKILYNKLILGI